MGETLSQGFGEVAGGIQEQFSLPSTGFLGDVQELRWLQVLLWRLQRGSSYLGTWQV